MHIAKHFPHCYQLCEKMNKLYMAAHHGIRTALLFAFWCYIESHLKHVWAAEYLTATWFIIFNALASCGICIQRDTNLNKNIGDSFRFFYYVLLNIFSYTTPLFFPEKILVLNTLSSAVLMNMCCLVRLYSSSFLYYI